MAPCWGAPCGTKLAQLQATKRERSHICSYAALLFLQQLYLEAFRDGNSEKNLPLCEITAGLCFMGESKVNKKRT